jgi:hypothetical protein
VAVVAVVVVAAAVVVVGAGVGRGVARLVRGGAARLLRLPLVGPSSEKSFGKKSIPLRWLRSKKSHTSFAIACVSLTK